MKNLSKGFVLLILFAVLALIIMVGGVYYFKQKNHSSNQMAPVSDMPNDMGQELSPANQKIKDILVNNVLRNMEYFFDDHNVNNGSPNSMLNYGPAQAKGNCYAQNTAFSESGVAKSINEILAVHAEKGSTAKISCWNDDKKWAVSVSLISPEKGKGYWCIDNNTPGVYQTGIGVNQEVSSVSCK